METHTDLFLQIPEPDHPASPEFMKAVRQRARQLYELHGRVPGHDLENWMQAEAEVGARLAAQAVSSPHDVEAPHKVRHVKIKIDHVIYTGEYDPATSGQYKPTEFNAGAPVEVFFEGDSMILKRRNGEPLRTRIVRREQEDGHSR